MQKVVLPTQDKYLSGIRNIIENKAGINALHTEDYFEKEYTKYVGNYEKFVLRYRFFEYFCSYLPSLINQIFGVAYLFIAAVLVFQGNITAGVLLMGYQYLGYFSNPISIVCGILMRYRSNKIHIERVDELTLDAEQPNELAAYRTEEEAIFAADDLDFYKGDQPEDFLYHIQHMEIRKNGLYVIKGENGSGKSMLMNLILGNITPKNCKGTFSVAKDIDNTAFLTYPIFTVDGSFEDNLYEKPRKDHLIQMLGIDFEDKEIASNPINLSYGQQQKLALYRVFASDTPVFFLDEPLSNLDAKLRASMRTEIAKLHQKLDITFVYVTHDQTEAMTMGDRIVVMKEGIVQQFDTPQVLYDTPDNLFVAGFIGSPQMNFMEADIRQEGEKLYAIVRGNKLLIPDFKKKALVPYVGKNVVMGLRLEDFLPKEKMTKDNTLNAEMNFSELMGADYHLHLTVDDIPITVKIASSEEPLAKGPAKVAAKMEKAHFFDKDTEKAICH